MKITTQTETIVKRTFVLEIDEDELTAALVDPRPLQRELRQARNAQVTKPNWATNGHAGYKTRARKTIEKKSGKESLRTRRAVASLNQMNLVPCPRCGEKFKARGLNKHLSACQGPDPLAKPLDE